MIQPDTLQRLACFLSQYVQCWYMRVIEPDTAMVKDAIALLIDEEVMTAEEIRREALKEFAVIIPAELLTEKATGRPLPDHITE